MLLATKIAIEEAVDRRRFPRRESNAKGAIHPHDGGSKVQCILENVSISGARLHLEKPAVLPPFSCSLCLRNASNAIACWLGQKAIAPASDSADVATADGVLCHF